MDPLDPLTEIINSGQGFSPAIALERMIWAMIGIFFLGAISRSITNSMRSQNWFGRNFLFSHSKDFIVFNLYGGFGYFFYKI